MDQNFFLKKVYQTKMPKHSSCSDVKQIPITFDVVDEFFVYQNQPFTVILNIKKVNDEVTIDFPALNW